MFQNWIFRRPGGIYERGRRRIASTQPIIAGADIMLHIDMAPELAFEVPAPLLELGMMPTPVELAWEVPDPVIVVSMPIAPVEMAWEVPDPVVQLNLLPAPVEMVLEVGMPVVTVDNDIQLTPMPVTFEWEVPDPNIVTPITLTPDPVEFQFELPPGMILAGATPMIVSHYGTRRFDLGNLMVEGNDSTYYHSARSKDPKKQVNFWIHVMDPANISAGTLAIEGLPSANGRPVDILTRDLTAQGADEFVSLSTMFPYVRASIRSGTSSPMAMVQITLQP